MFSVDKPPVAISLSAHEYIAAPARSVNAHCRSAWRILRSVSIEEGDLHVHVMVALVVDPRLNVHGEANGVSEYVLSGHIGILRRIFAGSV